MPFPQFFAGMRFTAAHAAALQWTEIIQGTTLTVNNLTSYQNTNLVVPTVVGARYRYQLLAAITSSPQVKVNWEMPTGGDVDRFGQGPGSAATGGSGQLTEMTSIRATGAQDVVLDGATNTAYVEHGDIIAGSVDGDFIFQFAQNSATAADSHFSGASRLWFIRVDE